jgi:hypothetical protein
MFKRHRLAVSVALKCGFLILSVAVFTWSLAGKLAPYHPQAATSCSLSAMVKLSTESPAHRHLAGITHQRPAPESLQFAEVPLLLADDFNAPSLHLFAALPPHAPQCRSVLPLLRRPPPALA